MKRLLLITCCLLWSCDPPNSPPALASVEKYGLDEVWLKESVGPVRVGIDTAQAVAALGEPISKSEPVMQEAIGELSTTWTWEGIKLELTSETKDGPWIVASIQLDSALHATQRGIRIGSTVEELTTAYPEISSEGNQYLYGDVYGGIAFSVSGGRVASVFVGAQAE